jgi:hypothetical protein
MAEWVIDKLTGNGIERGAGGGQEVVSGKLDTLVRETLQNSKDQQANSDTPVRVRYSLLELTGNRRTQFLKSMGWGRLTRHMEACTKQPGATGVRFRQGISSVDDGGKPLRLLRIEDSGTKGLDGDEHEEDRNFQLLCRAEFKTSTQRGRGGSRGVGKAVLWKFSEIATVLLSSRAQGLEKKGIRLFGRSDIPSHVIKGEGKYQSTALFGEKGVSGGAQCAVSIFGDRALAQALLLDRPSSSETGTSVLIVQFYEPEEDGSRSLKEIAQDILASSTRWFWPSMSGEHPSLEVEVIVERDGKKIFQETANPHPNWEPFILARRDAATGEIARLAGEVAESPIRFMVPQRVLPASEQHTEFATSLQLRVRRAPENWINHEKANCVAVFRGAEMIVKYVPTRRKPLDNVPFFAVLMAAEAIREDADHFKAEEFFRAAEPPMHNDWMFTEYVKHSYRPGAKVRLRDLWGSLHEEVSELIEETVTPREHGPELLAQLFPIGQAHKGNGPRHLVETTVQQASYLGGKWRITGDVRRLKPDPKPWKVRIGFVAETDSGPGEFLKISTLTTSRKSKCVPTVGAGPATVAAQSSIDHFTFEAVLEPSESLDGKDLDLTAIRLSSGAA